MDYNLRGYQAILRHIVVVVLPTTLDREIQEYEKGNTEENTNQG